VIVRSDLKGSGLGYRLMSKMIAHLRQRGTRRLVGTVLRVNTGMLELARSLGFQEGSNPADPQDRETRYVSLDL
jgi:acetyltransferase